MPNPETVYQYLGQLNLPVKSSTSEEIREKGLGNAAWQARLYHLKSDQTGSRQTESRQTRSRQTVSRQTGSRQTGSRHTGTKQTGPRLTGSRQTGPDRPVQTDQFRPTRWGRSDANRAPPAWERNFVNENECYAASQLFAKMKK